MVLYAHGHLEVVTLTRAIHTRRTQYHIRERHLLLYISLGKQLTLAVCRVRRRHITLRYGKIGHLLVLWSVDAERTHVDKLAWLHSHPGKSIDKVPCTLVVHPVEIILVKTLCNARRMHNIIPCTMNGLECLQLLRKPVLV